MSPGPELGCIADDFTGATDLAGNLAQAGRRAVVTVGVPASPVPDADAVVVALKSRTAPRQRAVGESLRAHRALAAMGCGRIWFKYCSTFDSTSEGNIGPVTDALLEATGAAWTIACPAFPAGGRTVYQGHLFVHGRPLDETGMRHHPLTPMTDSDLVRVLRPQTAYGVGLLPHQVLRAGHRAVLAHVARLTADGRVRTVVTDAVDEKDLAVVERATRHLPLVTGGSGLALSLPGGVPGARAVEAAPGPAAILAGSVSEATLAQTAHARRTLPARKLSAPDVLRSPADAAAAAVAWAAPHLAAGRTVVLHSADDREDVRRARERHGGAHGAAEQAVEETFAACARGLAERGVRRFVVAGGETSGAVVTALGVRTLRIGPAIAPGVPWTCASWRGRTVNLALKSGNFGDPDLFTAAQRYLDHPATTAPIRR
ncbi:four-carbon acid sugar kinase family protein [Streptomyces tubbatahanensis]|uniref:3-oxo-tetronate kinase n=1 Tax=Streptomyces tubbatahanensis TaxID=2923272 RepID=A0ABY3Y0A0_9ACTN|nr:3-oxo-tetronate kinase [Streptomyces tubbatahanensis]UNT00072.1 four-carbon acid sugar kinase family protein [Streptomyces tubbatahanensis]